MAQRKHIPLGNIRLQVRSLALLSGLGIWHCHELSCRSQMQLRSGVAVALVQVGSNSSNQTPSLGTSICHECSPKKDRKKKKKKPISIHEDAGLISGLTQWIKDLVLQQTAAQLADVAQIQHCCDYGIGLSYSSDLTSSLGNFIWQRCDHKNEMK